MQIEVGILISVVNLAAALVVNVLTIRRNNKHDDKQEATELTMLIAKIENINTNISEMKGDVRSVRTDIQNIRERLIAVEQKATAAHQRLDKLEGKEYER